MRERKGLRKPRSRRRWRAIATSLKEVEEVLTEEDAIDAIGLTPFVSFGPLVIEIEVVDPCSLYKLEGIYRDSSSPSLSSLGGWGRLVWLTPCFLLCLRWYAFLF
jgi:hypothetical protein